MRIRLKEARKLLSLSLSSLAEKLQDDHNIEITAPSLFKIETGETKKIRQNILDGLSSILGISSADIEYNQAKQLRIGFPYVTWAAPIVLSICDIIEDESEFSVTAYGTFPSESGTDSQDSLTEAMQAERNTLHEISEPIHLDLIKYSLELKKNNERIYTYNAKHLFNLLENGKLDLICVADGVVDLRYNKNDFVTVAYFLKSVNEGCELAVFSRKTSDELEKIMTFENLVKHFEDVDKDNINQVYKALESNDNIVFNKNYQEKIEKSIIRILERNNIPNKEKELLTKLKDDGKKSNKYFELLRTSYRNQAQKEIVKSIIEVTFELIILYAEKTVAQIYYDKFLRKPDLSFISPHQICLANPSRWNKTLSELIYPFEGNRECELEICYLGWQPKISHIRDEIMRVTKTSSKSWNFKIFNLPKIINNNEQVFLSGQLLIKKNKNTEILANLIYRFANKLKISSDRFNFIINEIRKLENNYTNLDNQLKNLKNEELNQPESEFLKNFMKVQELSVKNAEKEFIYSIESSPEIKIISDFFDLPKLECYTSIKNLVFSHSFDTDWINEYILNLQNTKSKN